MSFKRMEGFIGSVPQKFIDKNIPKCPMCGSDNPHWSLDEKIQFKLEGDRYLFKCERCGCILSSPKADVIGFNNTILTNSGLIKRFSGKQNGVIYFIIREVGSVQTTKLYESKEFTLQDLNDLASKMG